MLEKGETGTFVIGTKLNDIYVGTRVRMQSKPRTPAFLESGSYI